MADDLRRVVNSPDGRRYEIKGAAREWKLGTGSVPLDTAAFIWATIRQARSKEWVVSVHLIDSEKDPIIKRLEKTHDDATSSINQLAEEIENGQLAPPDQ